MNIDTNIVEMIGFVGASCTTASFVPQVISILKTKAVDGISIGMYSLFVFGILMWLLYGLSIGSLPIIIANAITIVLASMVLLLTIKYKK